MTKPEEHLYQKLRVQLFQANYFSSNLVEKAKNLKHQDPESYLEKIESIKGYLLSKMKERDNVAYSLYRVAHEEELSQIDELNNFDKIKTFLQTHTSLPNLSNNPFFDPKVVYFAEVLGSHEELWIQEDA